MGVLFLLRFRLLINSINCLHDVLLPHFDEAMKEDIDSFSNKLEEAIKKTNEFLNNRLKNIKENYSEGNERAIEKCEYEIMSGYIEPGTHEARIFSDEKLKAYRFLFQSLLKLYGRRRYLMAEVIDDEHNA